MTKSTKPTKPTKPAKPKKYNRTPQFNIRFTDDDLQQIDRIVKANSHIRTRAEAIRFAIHQIANKP